MKNIVVVNAHWNNRGDEAALRALLNQINQIIDDVNITIIFKDKGPILQFPHEKNVTYCSTRFLPNAIQVYSVLIFNGLFVKNHDMKKTIKIIEMADIVIYAPGGAVVSDRFWWRKQLEYLFPIAIAQKKGIPTFMAAPSIGPFTKKKRFRNNVLKNMDYICVRESLSERALKNQVKINNIKTTIDSAFLDDIDEKKYKKEMQLDADLSRFMESYDKIVGITVTDFEWHVKYQKNDLLKTNIYTSFQTIIHYFKERNIGVMLIPQLFGNQNDSNYLKKFSNDNTFILDQKYDTYFQQYIISQLYFNIGMRYHSNIFAAKMGVPFLAIIYEEKMLGFLKDNRLEEYAIPLESLSPELLIKQFEILEKNRERIMLILKKRRQEWRLKALDTVNELVGIINKID